jgi:hypothetical protein
MNTVPINWGFVKEPGKTPIEKILPSVSTSYSGPLSPKSKSVENPYRKTSSDNLRCTDVATHLTDCPVCSDLQGKQKLLYICLGAIAVIVFFLIKRTLSRA